MSNLKGIIPAIPTPLLPGETLDADGLRRLIDHVVDAGASAVFVLGSMGEGPALRDAERRAVVEVAAKHLAGRMPLLAAVSDASTRRVLDNAKAMEDAGADYLVTTAPFYYRHPHPDGILQFVGDLCDAASHPVVFYNLPGATGNPVDPATLERILLLDGVTALKDSSGDFATFMGLLRKYPDRAARPFRIFQGHEWLFDASLLMGADGVVTGGGTCFVEMLVRLLDAARSGDRAAAFREQEAFVRAMEEMLGPDLAIDWMARIKTRLSAMGICGDTITAPFLRRPAGGAG